MMKPELDPEPETEVGSTRWEAFVQGVKEGPRMYFAPLVLLYKAFRFVFRYADRKVRGVTASAFAKESRRSAP